MPTVQREAQIYRRRFSLTALALGLQLHLKSGPLVGSGIECGRGSVSFVSPWFPLVPSGSLEAI